MTCNPGGVGHQWVKRLFIDRQFKIDEQSPEENENPDEYRFIFATVEDNTHLMKASPAYVQMLSVLPENIRRAHRYGDWDALSGAYFPEFSVRKHVVRPFAVPDHWTRYRAFDYGLDMLAVLWVAVDETGRSYIYRELNLPGLIVSEAAAAIHNHTKPGEQIDATFAPPDLQSRQKDTGKTMSELFFAGGVPIVYSAGRPCAGVAPLKRAAGRPVGRSAWAACFRYLPDVYFKHSGDAG